MNIRRAFFDEFSRMQDFYNKHKDHITLINVQLSNNGRYILFYLAE